MTDDEKIEAVTAVLTGEFYVGQRVRTQLGSVGVVTRIRWQQHSDRDWFYITFADGTCPPYVASELTPL